MSHCAKEEFYLNFPANPQNKKWYTIYNKKSNVYRVCFNRCANFPGII